MNINDLSLDQLYALNEQVCQRIDYLLAQKDVNALQQFRLGMTVTFENKQGSREVGTLIKINRKSVIVVSEDGTKKWKIAPGLVTPLQEINPTK
jgi:hypothetical protein